MQQKQSITKKPRLIPWEYNVKKGKIVENIGIQKKTIFVRLKEIHLVHKKRTKLKYAR